MRTKHWKALLLVLASLLSFGSYSDSTSNILGSTWSGNYGSGYWGGNSGGQTPNLGGNTFYWGYGRGIISQTIAINQALAQTGIQVEGFQYQWHIKNGNANLYQQQGGADDFAITVDVYKANGDLYRSYEYDYGYSHDWTYHTGTETFPDQFLDPSFFGNLSVEAEGNDVGYWAGHYGPEFNVANSYITLTYSANPCYNNALYDPQCDGYAEAYAQFLYDQSCAADALYDTGCPGYAAAYFNQQCTMSGLYDTTCPNYAEAVAQEYVFTEEDHHEEEVSTTSTETMLFLDPEEIAEVPITGDPVVDSVLGDLTETVEPEPIAVVEVIEEPVEEVETTETVEIVQTESEDDPELVDDEEPDAKQNIKKAAVERAKNLAKNLSDAASLEQQKASQAQILALINYTPGFNEYQKVLNGGYLPDAQGYAETRVPESRKGLRNGLAQQLLHQKMVDMQYRREK